MKRFEFSKNALITVDELSGNRICIGAVDKNGELLDEGELVIPRNMVSRLINILMTYDDENVYVVWSVEDFDLRAAETEELEGVEIGTMFNRDLFKRAMDHMIHDHDCNLGITWDTIDCYLYEYCKVE